MSLEHFQTIYSYFIHLISINTTSILELFILILYFFLFLLLLRLHIQFVLVVLFFRLINSSSSTYLNIFTNNAARVTRLTLKITSVLMNNNNK